MKNNSIVPATRQSAAILNGSSHRRFSKRRYDGLVILTFCLLTSAFCLCAPAQSYSIDWWKVAGGGGTSTGGAYQISGTIGQPDASAIPTGGNYSLTGGFWSLIAAVQTPGAPLLTIALNPQLSTINITWPSPSTGFELQQNSDLANTNGWSAYGGTVSDNGTNKCVTISPPTGNHFYRLLKP